MAWTRSSDPAQGPADILEEYGQKQDLADVGLKIAEYASVLWRALPTLKPAKSAEFEFNVDSVTPAGDTLAADCLTSDTTITVTDASLYQIGEIIALPDPTAQTIEIARITALDEGTNVLTLATRPYAGTKAVNTVPSATLFKRMGVSGDFDRNTVATAVSEPARRWYGYIQQWEWGASFEDILEQTDTLDSSMLNAHKKKAMEILMGQVNQAFLYGPCTVGSYIVGKPAGSTTKRNLSGGVVTFVDSRPASKIDGTSHDGTLSEDEFFTYLMLPIAQGGVPSKIFADQIGMRCLETWTRSKVETGQDNAKLQQKISEVASTTIPPVRVYFDSSIGRIESNIPGRTGRILVLDKRYVGKKFMQNGGTMRWRPEPHTGNVTTGFFRLQCGLQISHSECHLDICDFSGPA